MQNEAKLLTITQAAEFLKISSDTLRRWEDKGIVTPTRTKGGSRRYTLLDLKIARLNKQSLRLRLKKKIRFFQIPSLLKENYINHKRDFRIALLTSFLWIFGLLIYQFLTPVFLRPTNPEQQILSAELKESARLRVVSETTPIETSFSLRNKVYAIEVRLPSDQAPVVLKMTPSVAGQNADLLIGRSGDVPTLQYTNTIDQYYSLQPLPQNQILSIIKRS
ncbi:hypothetical protein A3J19_00520 [Candidatus Daviesbacteria bacterium RIFCSPLOWO2_02_FULL_41_8]|uniref:HTH merR-type domain-containing protein n=3 Tax=Candidatus Daviesiibacteriota TaxID=1752718 RepID=A0A1F5NM95_9BACT|nr:MAG: hypothetical protein A2871_01315 [Candidatus Daviesbacteria bacterium RIFCSPHIGHO2_01_FULL_41_23]OGE33918.1 MAG: hypothetical protein A3D83_04770 [Candidatus Daviesbacteria bacterium RIFCSPHIGHO2_02_FULL_41_10]OGE78632.1 MAG: hypothetical protein A3J19_00520 [Candidatus Daviesbacteria bacterium RIFCSPLOWO2_02_FULL_41_8]